MSGIALFHHVFDELPVGVVVVRLEKTADPESWIIVEMNRVGRQLSGAKDENPAGRRLLDYAPEVRDSALTRACVEVLTQNHGVEVTDFTSTTRVPGGRFAIKVFALGGPLIGLAFEDVSLRRSAQDALVRSRHALEELTADLARSNKELTQFAYVASHDLQAPLRKATAFANHLRRRLAGTLNAPDLDFLTRLDRSLAGMQTLIDALLLLARVATHCEPHRPVDLTAVAADVIEDLEEPITHAGARVQISDLPVVMGDASQMRQLLQNLIDNALKFRRPGAAPLIRVTGRARGEQCEIKVEDDGIGFDMKYAERIFQPFQRLHGVKDYPGSGMGLAICRKIVERHGGTITTISAPGRGAAFNVVLPAALLPPRRV